jgi:phospholipase A-2-activating protein
MLDTFPAAEVFPALDLARLTVLHPDAASSKNAAFWAKVIDKTIALCGDEDVNSVAVPMLSLRLFANAFHGGPGSREAVSGPLDAVLACASKFIPSKNKNVRLSVATLLCNISYSFHSQPPARPDVAQELVGAVNAILKARTYDGEAITRVLVALGTAALASPEAKEAAKTMHIVSLVEMSASPHGDIAKTVAKEVYNVMAQ